MRAPYARNNIPGWAWMPDIYGSTFHLCDVTKDHRKVLVAICGKTCDVRGADDCEHMCDRCFWLVRQVVYDSILEGGDHAASV